MRQKTPNCERFFLAENFVGPSPRGARDSARFWWHSGRRGRAKNDFENRASDGEKKLTKSAVKKIVGLRAMMRGSGPGPGLRSRPHVFKPHPPTTLERATDMSLGGLHSCIL